MNASAQAQSSHFNLHVNGVGYLNRIRWVESSKKAGRRGQPFLACSINALRGDANEPNTTYFDLRVSGSEAIQMVEQLQEAVEARRKVFVSFRVGDIYPHVYERDERDQDGRPTGRKEMASLIKGRLLLINSITVDGENVYRRDPDATPPEAEAMPEEAGDSESDAGVPGDAAPAPQRPATTRMQPNGQQQARPQAMTRQARPQGRAYQPASAGHTFRGERYRAAA